MSMTGSDLFEPPVETVSDDAVCSLDMSCGEFEVRRGYQLETEATRGMSLISTSSSSSALTVCLLLEFGVTSGSEI